MTDFNPYRASLIHPAPAPLEEDAAAERRENRARVALVLVVSFVLLALWWFE